MFDIVSGAQRCHKIIFSIGTVFQTFCKNLTFSNICDIYNFGWDLFSPMQFRKRPKGLNKMNISPERVSQPIRLGSVH